MLHTFFLVLCLSFLSGVFVQNIFEEAYISLLLFLFLGVLYFAFTLWGTFRYKYYYLCISSLGVCLGILLSHFFGSIVEQNISFLSPLEYQKNTIEAYIDSVYEVQEYNTLYKAKTLSINGHNVDNTLFHIVRIPQNYSLRKGDIISYTSYISIVDNFDTFEYRKFQISRGIYFSSSASVFVKKDFHKSWSSSLSTLRERLLDRMDSLYPGEEKLFLAGILFGAREEIPKDLEEDFNNSGLTHILAVSGFNISILILFLGFFVERLPSPLRLLCMMGGIFFFVAFVGYGAPVVRAGIMGILGYTLLHLGRTPQTFSLIVLTASTMTAFSPLSLNYDVSFHLSFLAVLGIYFTQGFFKKIFFFIPPIFAIQEAFVLTLSALSLTFPIMLFQFGQVSLLAPFANVAVTWMIPFAMLLGGISLLFSFFFPFLAPVFAFCTFLLLRFALEVVHFFGNIDWALLKIDFGLAAVYAEVLYFLILSFLILYFRQKNQPKLIL